MNNNQALKAHNKDLGNGFIVRRLLPNAARQAVGPFIFFDHFGPVTVTPADNHDVRPHPHIGLATISYLFDGVIMHRDNLGYTQRIEPGAINLMIAGRGIVHSERKPEAERDSTYVNHGLQLWIALPTDQEKIQPTFSHTPASMIPELNQDGTLIRVLMGTAFEITSPVQTLSPTLYLDVQIPPYSTWQLPLLAQEQAIYVISGAIQMNGDALIENQMQLIDSTMSFTTHSQASRLVVIGGEPLGHRFIWWNFVATKKEDIALAAQAWEQQDDTVGMGQVPGENERIPLPKRPD